MFVLADSASRFRTQPPPVGVVLVLPASGRLISSKHHPARVLPSCWDEQAAGSVLSSGPGCEAPWFLLFAGTGNIAEDMEKQLQANDIRIGVLEQENTRLRAAPKLKAAAQQGVLQVRLNPSRGWELAGEGRTCWGGTACPRRSAWW